MAELAQGSFYMTATIASVAANSGLVRNRPCATPQRIRLEKRSSLLRRADNCRLYGTGTALFIASPQLTREPLQKINHWSSSGKLTWQ